MTLRNGVERRSQTETLLLPTDQMTGGSVALEIES